MVCTKSCVSLKPHFRILRDGDVVILLLVTDVGQLSKPWDRPDRLVLNFDVSRKDPENYSISRFKATH